MGKLGRKLREALGVHESGSKKHSADSQDPRKHHNPTGAVPNKQGNKIRGGEDGHGKVQTPSQEVLKSNFPLMLPADTSPLEEKSTTTEVTPPSFSPKFVLPTAFSQGGNTPSSTEITK